MKTKIIILLLFPILGFGQTIDTCSFKFRTIFDFQGDSIGKSCLYFQPILLMDTFINIGDFYEINANLSEDRIYVLDIPRNSDIVYGDRFLKIFDLSGKLLFEQKKNLSQHKPSRLKHMSIASDGKIMLWTSDRKDDGVFEIIKILNKNGKEIHYQEFELTKNHFLIQPFDINSKGRFIFCFSHELALNEENSTRNWNIYTYSRKGKVIWKTNLELDYIYDITMNDKGLSAILCQERKNESTQQKIIYINKKGEIIDEITLQNSFTRIDFGKKKSVNLRKGYPRDYIKLKINY